MGRTADKLNKLLETKAAIKQAIIDKGVDISDTDTFASYPEKIESIKTGGGDGTDLLDVITDGGTRGAHLFRDSSAIELDLSDLDTSEMTNMSYMFNGCKNLVSLDLSNFNTGNVTNMTAMFDKCENLQNLDISGFDFSKVSTIGYMFRDCAKIQSLTLGGTSFGKPASLSQVFSGCKKLTFLDISVMDISNITSTTGLNLMFASCDALVDFYPPQNINTNMSVSSSTALSHDSLLRILNNLMETTTTKTLTLGTTNLAKLSDEEKAIVTNKGWTLK
jgi:surface protein